MSRRIPAYKKLASAKLDYCNRTEKNDKNCLNGGKCLTIVLNNLRRFSKCLCPRKFNGENCNRSPLASRTMHKHFKKSVNKIERSIHLQSNLTKYGIINCAGEFDDVICLNGGTCFNITFFNSSSEILCQCADGFEGQFCKYKTVQFPIETKQKKIK